ncbi:TPA: nitrate ABC transporter ATP-binding protein, partial [Burkholderia multivorans]|nr:nitrate ABC transporter ATP-binding protein [Burkholderia multivorans]HDR9299159.1 nitrate ABC transporter ATP-binding protein [Burkholderia multivorans]HDR9399010.1 nitrate ABC transporter ATP-binding protein [Burkholderia multivorans]HDR9404603.1 nitrate ABC transporter ATP-binding protein [Burkholderia multivorans]HDR9456104.1 nitrate ABC transporter ATP-binding protein [Burkholderia multivorans]
MQNPTVVNAPVQMPSTPPSQVPRIGEEILRVEHVCRGFNKTQGELLVLDDANLSLREGEIVGLLGRSGS